MLLPPILIKDTFITTSYFVLLTTSNITNITTASELTSTYKDCENEVRELKRKHENLNQYLGRTQPDLAQEKQEKYHSL